MFPPETMHTTATLTAEPGQRRGDGKARGTLADDARSFQQRRALLRRRPRARSRRRP